jgi:hypothetical protein
VRISLEAVKAFAAVSAIELDPGRVESILEIALSNAANVRQALRALYTLHTLPCAHQCA